MLQQHKIFRFALLYLCMTVALFDAHAQTATPTPRRPTLVAPTNETTPERQDADAIRIQTEEVRVPVSVTDEFGRIDPTLAAEDFLIIENGVQQQTRSARRIPANVLLLLDTGSAVNLAKLTSTTRRAASSVVDGLRAGDEVAIVQFNDRVELLQSWTSDFAAANQVLRTKLKSGRNAKLSEALLFATNFLREKPSANRHVVLITDGVENKDGRLASSEAVRVLTRSGAMVHVISYTEFARRELNGKANPRASNAPPGSVRSSGIATAAINPTRSPVQDAPRGDGINFDPALKRLRKTYERATKSSEAQLRTLAEETGGELLLPITADELVAQGARVMRDIATQYVVTYTPKSPLANAVPGEKRDVEIVARRGGLNLRYRRSYTVSEVSGKP